MIKKLKIVFNKKNKIKIIIVSLSIVILAIVFIKPYISSCSFSTYIPIGSCTSFKISDYENRRLEFDGAIEVLPRLEDLPPYKNIKYKYRNSSLFITTAEAIMLVVKYDSSTYEAEKQKLSTRNYLEPMRLHSYEDPRYVETLKSEYEINSFTFRMLDLEKTAKTMTYIPKEAAFIATSDKKKTIAYLYFHCYDCDYVNDNNPVIEFIKTNFRYKW